MNEEWRRLMLTLPDSLFFDIVRNYTGTFRTPFNKHTLIKRLEAFFLREETMERIFAFISPRDAEVLEAVRFFGEPPLKTILLFFGREEGERDLRHELLNLEYRLLVITDSEEEERKLRLNPLLRDDLEERALGPEVLFPSRPAEKTFDSLPWLQDTTVVGFLAFFDQNRTVLKSDGSLKKRPSDRLNECFPGIFAPTPAGRRGDMCIRALRSLGLLLREGENLVPQWNKLDRFVKLPRKDRLCYYWSRAIQGRVNQGVRYAELMKGVIDGLVPGRNYPRASLLRFITGMYMKHGLPGPDPKQFIGLLSALGIVEDREEGLQITSKLFVEETDSPETVLFQPNMQITVKPEAPPAYLIPAARSADLQRADLYIQFEIHKGSFNRILRAGWSAEDFIKTFDKAGSGIPANLKALLAEWEQEYRRVQLFDGIVLTVAEEVRHLVEHDSGVRRWIRHTVAPGVYLFSREEYRQWSRALEKAGIEQLPAITTAAPYKAGEEKNGGAAFPGLRALTGPLKPKVKGNQKNPGPYEEELYKALSGLSVDRDTEKELSARIKRRVILFPEQLDTDILAAFGKCEAKGLDFMGKVRIIEQTMQSGREILEIIERTSEGGPRRYFLTPVRLDKTGKELTLIALTLPERKELRLEVRKLSLVRRLKSALFYPSAD